MDDDAKIFLSLLLIQRLEYRIAYKNKYFIVVYINNIYIIYVIYYKFITDLLY